uniref:TF-B3 domain-containing protein n=1 Tax=Oryza brachyantha TaxID=4533 RepID=J3KUF5_ORYBR
MANKNSLLHTSPLTQQAQIAARPPSQATTSQMRPSEKLYLFTMNKTTICRNKMYFSTTYTIGHIKPHLLGKKTEITANTPGTAPSNRTVTMSTDGCYNITAGWTKFVIKHNIIINIVCAFCFTTQNGHPHATIRIL